MLVRVKSMASDGESTELELPKCDNLLDTSLNDDGTERKLDSTNNVNVLDLDENSNVMTPNTGSLTAEECTYNNNGDESDENGKPIVELTVEEDLQFLDDDVDNNVASESTLKAMRIAEVLEVVVKHLPLTQLKELRLLSKTWNYVIIPEIRKHHVPIQFITMTELNKFVEMKMKSCKIIFTKYNTKQIPFKSCEMIRLFDVCGYFINELEISIPKVFSKYFIPMLAKLVNLVQLKLNSEDRVSIFSLLTNRKDNWNGNDIDNNNMPPSCFLNLKKIILSFDHINVQNGTRNFILKLMTATTPKLQHFSHEKDNVDYWELFGSFNFNKFILSKFTTFRLEQLRKAHLDLLMDLTNHGLALKEFIIGNFPEFENLKRMAQLENFLMLQSTSLTSFKFRTESVHGWNINNKLPIMTRLKKLNLGLLRHGCYSFDSFISHFPMLSELKLCFSRRQSDEVIGSTVWLSHMKEIDPHHNMKVLDLENYDGINSTHQLEDVITLFPNLTSLHTNLETLDLISIVFDKLPKLQILMIKDSQGELDEDDDETESVEYSSPVTNSSTVTSSSSITTSSTCAITYTNTTTTITTSKLRTVHVVLDELVTGIPKENHRFLKCRLQNDSPSQILHELKVKPGITDLKELQEFKIITNGIMTDISGYFGFGIPGTKLSKLEIYNPRPSEISLDCCEAIRKNMPINSNIHIVQSDPYHQLSRDKIYFTTKLKSSSPK